MREMAPQRLVQRIEAAALDTVTGPPPRPVRIAFVTPWGVRCGIAEYSRALLSGFTADDIAGLTLITDDRCVSRSWNAPWPSPKAAPTAAPIPIHAAWRLGLPRPELPLAEAIAVADPDIVVIQHQPMLIDWPSLARLIRAPELRGRPICITLHNTQHLLEPVKPVETVLHALRACARLLVHTLADVERLADAGVSDNVTMLPHGAPVALTKGPRPAAARPLSRESDPVLGCYGFFLPHKGIAELISAVALLRKLWPRLRLRLINAEYDCAESRATIAACREAAAWAGLDGAIDWHTEFLPVDDSRALLAGCDLVVMPYQATTESVSGALHIALSTGVPVAATPIPIFDEAEGAVARFAGTSPLQIAKGIEQLLSDPTRRAALQTSAASWLADRTWPAIAERFQGLITGLARHAP